MNALLRLAWITSVSLALAIWSLACEGGDQAASPAPSGTPQASPPTSVASPSPSGAPGKIAYTDPEGNLALMNPDGSGTEVLTDGGGVEGFRWSPDGSLIALEGGAGFGVWVMRFDGEVLFELGDASAPVWSPQGDRLAVSRGSGIGVYDTAGGEVLEVADATGSSWSPDGETLALLRTAVDDKGMPMLVALATGDEVLLSDDIEADDPVYPLAWHPEGGSIAYRGGIYDLTGGDKVDLPGVPVVWSRDGRLVLVTLEFDPEFSATPANLLDMSQGGKPVIGLDVRSASGDSPAWLYIQRWIGWSPDGRLLIYLDPEPGRFRARIYDTVAITQTIYKDVRGERPSVSPDNARVVFMDEGKIWLMALDGSSLVKIAEGSYPAWQPGGP